MARRLESPQLTNLQSSSTGSATWSPDSQSLLFDSRAEGQPEIYVIKADGTHLRRLTNNPAADIVPTWSPDGKWIYFASSRSGDLQIWRMAASGGTAEQVTHDGGFATRFSPDGKWLLYTKFGTDSPVWRMPVDGASAAVMMVPSIRDRCFAPSAQGLYVIGRRGTESTYALMLYPWSDGQPSVIQTITRTVLPGMSVSPDGRTILYAQVDEDNVNLMLVENWH